MPKVEGQKDEMWEELFAQMEDGRPIIIWLEKPAGKVPAEITDVRLEHGVINVTVETVR